MGHHYFWGGAGRLQADDGVNVYYAVPFEGNVGAAVAAAVAAVAHTPNQMYVPASDSMTAAASDDVLANGP